MAFQAGLINIGGFMACHRFVSHITGFATFFGYEINQADTSAALSMLVVPMFFLFGCMISGFLERGEFSEHNVLRLAVGESIH